MSVAIASLDEAIAALFCLDLCLKNRSGRTAEWRAGDGAPFPLARSSQQSCKSE
ncbi:hypothetical protein [Aureimonas pseudogalii]|uniref:Uncharacterized protein n=1 Tax=Aureimonas pseudogalii TaxID=1744844 RepID=A0A7W6H3E7_9HYPH|nr:hypothetical protein [Aureimonas pseudogalii]MBB3997981.1 hypothetical protein [Aureimonas pseudogalii]